MSGVGNHKRTKILLLFILYRHAAFKKRLLENLKRKHNDREAREKYLTQTYSRLVQEWLRKVEKVLTFSV